nr:polyprotein [Apis mellifera solinvivirus 1]
MSYIDMNAEKQTNAEKHTNAERHMNAEKQQNAEKHTNAEKHMNAEKHKQTKNAEMHMKAGKHCVSKHILSRARVLQARKYKRKELNLPWNEIRDKITPDFAFILGCSIYPFLYPASKLFERFDKRRQMIKNFNNLQNEANQETLEVKSITQFIMTCLETFALPIIYITTLTSSLIGLITSIKTYLIMRKDSPKVGKVLLINSIVNFISTLLLGIAGVTTAEFPELPSFSDDIQQATELIIENLEPVKPSPSKREEFIKHVLDHQFTTPMQINEYFRANYSEFDFLLPPSRAPLKLPQPIRDAKDSFDNYPDEFLIIWWNTNPRYLFSCRSLIKMISPKPMNEDVRTDDEPKSTWRELSSDEEVKAVKDSFKKKKEQEAAVKVTMRKPKFDLPKNPFIRDHKQNKDDWEEIARGMDAEQELATAILDSHKVKPEDVKELQAEIKEIEDALKPKPVEEPIPLQQENFFEDSFVSMDSLKNFAEKIMIQVGCIIMAIGDAFVTKKTLNFKSIVDYLSLSKKINTIGGDLKEAIYVLLNKETPGDSLSNQAAEFALQFNQFLEQPSHVLARSLHLVAKIKDTLGDYERWQRALKNEDQHKFTGLHGLYAAASKKRFNFITSEMPTLSRQEPFVVLLQGGTGVGKTNLADEIVYRAARDILRVSPASAAVDITPSDKYWPPLGGMKDIYKFDEACTTKDIEKDLLFGNMKGICSPAYFNCAGADVEHKTNPCTAKIIVATSNTDFSDMAARVSEKTDPTTWQAYCRRMIIIQVERVSKHFDPNYPEQDTFDAENYSHLKLSQFEHRDGKLIKTKQLDLKRLMRMIEDKENFMANKHRAHLAKMALVKENSITHYSMVIHGQQGQGKSYFIEYLIRNMPSAFNFPIHYIKEKSDLLKFRKQTKRCILCIDDVIRNTADPEIENAFMDIYNNRLAPCSIVVNATNVSPKPTIPYLGGTHFCANRKLPFTNEGMGRRMGYVGCMDGNYLPTFNTEIYVSNQTYYKRDSNITLPFSTFIYAVLPFVISVSCILFHPIFFHISILLGIYAMYKTKILWTQDKQQGFPCNDLAQYVFQCYRDFMSTQREIPIHYRTFTKMDDYNLLIKARTGDDVIMSGDIADLSKHVFCNKSLYDRCRLPWKLYISPEIFCSFSKNYEKFLMRCNGFSEELMYTIVRKYVNALKDSGIEPKFYVEIDDLGRLEFRDGEISSDLRTETPALLNFAIVKTELEYLMLFGEHTVPVARMIKEPELAETLNLSYNESIEYNNYIKSDTFLSSEAYIQTHKVVVEEEIASFAAAKWKLTLDTIKKWKSHPIFKIVLIIFTIVATATIIIRIISFIKGNSMEKQRRKGSKKGNPKSKKYDSDDDHYRRQADSSDDEEEDQRRKGSKKGNPKSKKYDSDDDKKRQCLQEGRKKATKKGNPKTKKYDSDDDRTPQNCQNEDVKTLCDMNDFTPYKLYMQNAYLRARTNMLQVYTVYDDRDIIDFEPIGKQSCYGLFLTGTMFATVGHSVPAAGNLYACSDSFDKAHKCHLLYKYEYRDLSIWYIPSLEKKFCAKSIRKHFLSQDYYEDDITANAVIQRFGPNKTEEFHSGECTMFRTPFYFGKNSKKMGDYAQLSFGTSNIKLTTFGDCGLPYYFCETDPKYHDKIIGIHCMGNQLGYTSLGISCMIFKEDVVDWEALYQKVRSQQVSQSWNNPIVRAEADGEGPGKSPCCEFDVKTITIKADDKPKCEGHETIWHHMHLSTISTFVDEVMTFANQRKQLRGVIIKNSGKLYGTVEHSHTQFLPNQRLEVTSPHGWLIKSTTDMGIDRLPNTKVFVRTSALPFASFASHFSRLTDLGNDFRIKGCIYNEPVTKRLMFRFTLIVLFDSVSQKRCEIITALNTIQCINESNEDTFAIEPPFGGPVYVSQAVKEIIDTATLTRKRGHPEDVPYENVKDNETVRVLGSFHQSQSHTPKDHYYLSPFSSIVKDLIPIEKRPCIYELGKIPQDIQDTLARNNYDLPCQRTTQALQWAHPNYVIDEELGKVIDDEFSQKILRYYSGLRLLSDEEVLGGLPKSDPDHDYFKGMELDSSIGFTMKNLYKVMKKSDVIHCDENGKYTWLNNPASAYLKQEYQLAKDLSDQGKNYYVAYLELLKMEKLKLSKIYTGRTFVVQDTLGVLMERRILGMIAVRAMKDDITCGVGTDPFKNFHQYYLQLSQFQNIWAGDYKRFDRTEPADVFLRISKLLQKANPHMAKQIKSAFNAIVYRFQVSGTTLAHVQGGMPSGCTLTAPLNSIVNDYLLFSSYVALMRKFNLAFSWEHYEANVKRLFYGDDVLVSVSDELSEIFTRDKVSIVMMELFGMVLDSAAKDGSVATFDNWETASWISRSFRKIDQFPFIVGALKKISIGANFHYVTSTDLKHIGDLMTKALFEASFWDMEYYQTILTAIRRAISHKPALGKHVRIIDRAVIQREIYVEALPYLCSRHQQNLSINWADEVEREAELTQKEVEAQPITQEQVTENEDLNKTRFGQLTKDTQNFIDIEHSNAYKRKVLQSLKTIYHNKLKDLAMSYRSILNEKFQKGEIGPVHISNKRVGDEWECEVSTTKIANSEIFIAWGRGNSKAEAVEAASHAILIKMGYLKQQKKMAPQMRANLNHFVQEMNVAPQVSNVVPKAPFLASDVSVVPDAGLYTNTDAPAIAQDVNHTAIALDNPAGTGAAFSKHQSCYQIYQNWDEKNTTVNPSMANGTEIMRLTLDPKTWPKRIVDYIMFHDSILPALDIIVTIAGAAGTIGWIKSGWVKDASSTKKYTSGDLQQIESKVVNMNGTQVMKFTLNDVRRSGLYRLIENDPEPYPGIVFIVESAVTNVQRNDAVNYPIRVQAKLNPACLLMEPFRSSGSGPSVIDFPIGSYFYDDAVDMLVLGSSVPNKQPTENDIDDQGWLKGDFQPTFGAKNVIGMSWNEDMLDAPNKKLVIVTELPELTPEIITDFGAFKEMDDDLTTQIIPPNRIFYGFGKLPVEKFMDYNGKKDMPGATVYKTNFSVEIGNLKYGNSTTFIYPEGCVIMLEARYALHRTEIGNIPDCIAVVYLDSVKKNTFEFYQDTQQTLNISTFTYWNREQTHHLFDPVIGKIGNLGPDWKELVDDIKPTVKEVTKTFLCTSNTAPSTILPTGLKQISFVRKGTSTSDPHDNPSNVPEKPILKGVILGLEQVLQQLGTNGLVGNLEINGENIGQVGFADETLIVRTDDFKVIKVNVGTNVVLRNIVGITDLKGITQFNTKGFSSWVSQGLKKTKARRFNLNLCQYESFAGIAASGIGALMGSVGQNVMNQYNMDKIMEQQKLMQSMQLSNQRTIAEANNSAILARQQKAFENSLILKGYSSASAQSGLGYAEPNKNFVYSHVYQPNQGPQPKEVLNDKVYRNISGEEVSASDDEASPVLSEGDEQPIRYPAKEIKTATLLTNHAPASLQPSKGTVIPVKDLNDFAIDFKNQTGNDLFPKASQTFPNAGVTQHADQRNMPTLLPNDVLAQQSQQAVNNIAQTK